MVAQCQPAATRKHGGGEPKLVAGIRAFSSTGPITGSTGKLEGAEGSNMLRTPLTVDWI
jgi:hypothetical protein